jgi:hypothetical protein
VTVLIAGERIRTSVPGRDGPGHDPGRGRCDELQ